MNNSKVLTENPYLTVWIRSLYDIGGDTFGHVIKWMDENPRELKMLLDSLT